MNENECKYVQGRIRAISIASVYGLQNEVIYCMDKLGMSPDEALLEWDLQ